MEKEIKYVLFEKVNMDYLNMVRKQYGFEQIETQRKKIFCYAESEEEAKEIVIEAGPYGFTLHYETAEEYERNIGDYTTWLDDALLA